MVVKLKTNISVSKFLDFEEFSDAFNLPLSAEAFLQLPSIQCLAQQIH